MAESNYAYRDETGAWSPCIFKGRDRVGNLLLQTAEGKRFKVAPDDAFPVDPSAVDVADVLDLTHFNEASIFHTLSQRYARGIVYTSVGAALLAVNPYESLPTLFSPDAQRAYSRGDRSQRPHVYALLRDAFEGMLSNPDETQTVVLSGFVGSGKTETLKQSLRFLAMMERATALPSSEVAAALNRKTPKPSDMLQLSSTVLEAFGNAAIPENSNSSRFGRLVRIFFSRTTGSICGGNVVPYLFERTRTTIMQSGERNFHIFYQLVCGCSDEERKAYLLLPVNKYRYLSEGGVTEVPGVNDAEDFERTKNIMAVLGLGSRSTQAAIFRVLSAILHLGNVTFLWDEQNNGLRLKSDKPLRLAANLLGIDDELLRAVLFSAPAAPTLDDEEPAPYTKPPSDMRDLIAQAVYAKLFAWLVRTINERLAPPREVESVGVISILDQFGFQNCRSNGLHQLTVNYATERLYCDLVELRNADEQELFVSDGGAQWDPVSTDAAQCLGVFDTPETGLWDVLTDLTQDAAAVDIDILDRVFAYNPDSNIIYAGEQRYDMVVNHLSGPIVYNAKDFLINNQEQLPGDLATSFIESQTPFVRSLFADGEEEAPVLSARAVNDLDLVLSLVGPSRLYHVNCIASNAQGQRGVLDGALVASQLNALGVVTTGVLRRDGFLQLMPHLDALARYHVLLPSKQARVWKDPTTDMERLLKAVLYERRNDDAWTIGRDNVFITKAALMDLEDRRAARRQAAATTIASLVWRVRLFRRLRAVLPAKRAAPAGVTTSRANGAVRAPPSKRTSIPKALPPPPAAATVVKLSSEAMTAVRRTINNSAMQLTKLAITLVRLIHKDPIPREEVKNTLAEMKRTETDFKDLQRASMQSSVEYHDATELVLFGVQELLKAVRGALNGDGSRADVLSQCKSHHQDLVSAIREWRAVFARLDEASGGSGSQIETVGSPRGVAEPRRPSSGQPSATTATAPPKQRLPPPRQASANGDELRLPPKPPTKRSSSPPVSSVDAMSSPRGNGAGSPRGVEAPRVALGRSAPGVVGVVFHDSPKLKRRQEHKDLLRRVTTGADDVVSMKESMDKLDAQLVMKELKKDYAVVQLTMLDGLTVRAKVSTKMLCSEAKAYVLKKAATYSKALGQWDSPGDYLLKVYGARATIGNESVPLSRIGYVQACNYIYVLPILELTLASKWSTRAEVDLTAETALELKLSLVISKLIGKDEFANYLQHVDVEIDRFRACMTHARLEHAKELTAMAKEGRLFMLHEYMDAEPMPPAIPSSIKVNLSFAMHGADRSSSLIAFSPSDTVEQAIDKAVAKLRKMDPSQASAQSRSFLLKETGRQSFFLGDMPLLRYDSVRNQICAEKPVALSLVNKAATLESYADEVLAGSYMDSVLESWVDEHPLDVRACDTLTLDNVHDFARPWRVKMQSVQGVPERYLGARLVDEANDLFERWHLILRVSMFLGNDPLMAPQHTKPIEATANIRWDQWVFAPPINRMPRGARISVRLYALLAIGTPALLGEEAVAQSELVAWINFPVFGPEGVMGNVESLVALQMWPSSEPVDVTCLHNPLSDLVLYIKFEETKKPIVYPRPKRDYQLPSPARVAFVVAEKRIHKLIAQDPLTPLTAEEKRLLWENRAFLTEFPRALPQVLRSTDWSEFAHAQDMYTLMHKWCELQPAQVLAMLNGGSLDPFVREFAVERLKRFSDGELLLFVPQLTQALKVEAYLFNPLAEFMVDRALRNRHRLGHSFFWALKAEMHIPKIVGRYACMLESYLRGAGTHRTELEMQADLVHELVVVAKGLKELSTKPERDEFLKTRLTGLKLPPRFQLPLDPRYEVSGLVVDKCKYMDSKKVPLWLVFRNAEEGAPNVTVIFKEGDDLRQDILTIQMLRLMNNLWKQEGVDPGMNPYGCISCGDQIGMIEVVMNAMTTAGVAREFGGVKAVFRKDVMVKWLHQHNETPEKWERAQRNFMRSCAAYCVATYVLGIGDRHNDNIMCTKDGYFFHIDFGHFLGNFKKKLGIEREKAPFVFTQQYAAVLGGSRKAALFREFVDLCGRLFNVLRREVDLFVTLFQMMVMTGIPELRDERDIEWLTRCLRLDLSDNEAAKLFEKLIDESLASRTTLFNHAVHSMVH